MSNPILTQKNQKHNTITGETSFRFDSWDEVDSRLARLINRRRFDIVAWRFADSAYWHKELCEVPAGAALVIKWGELEPAELDEVSR